MSASSLDVSTKDAASALPLRLLDPAAQNRPESGPDPVVERSVKQIPC